MNQKIELYLEDKKNLVSHQHKNLKMKSTMIKIYSGKVKLAKQIFWLQYSKIAGCWMRCLELDSVQK